LSRSRASILSTQDFGHTKPDLFYSATRNQTLCGSFILSVLTACTSGSGDSPADLAPVWVAEVDCELAGPDAGGLRFLEASGIVVAAGEVYSLHPRERRIRVHRPAEQPSSRVLIGHEEMADPRGFGIVGDTLWIRDARPDVQLRLFSRTTGELLGTLRTSEPLHRGSKPVWLSGSHVTPDGTILARSSTRAWQIVAGIVKESVYLHMMPSGEILDTLATLSIARSVLGSTSDDGGGVFGANNFSDDPLIAFSPDATRFAVLDRTVTTDGPARAVLRVQGRDGSGRRETPIEYTPRRLDSRWVDAVVRGWQQELGQPHVQTDRLIRGQMYVPAHVPYASELQLTQDGRVWIREWDRWSVPEYGDPRRAGDANWLVLGADGSHLARVRLPIDFHWGHAEGDWLWGSQENPDRTSKLVRYRLRPEAGVPAEDALYRAGQPMAECVRRELQW
jgi:hypothetical protein